MSKPVSPIPGIKAGHAVILDNCRDVHGVWGAFDEAARRLKERYIETTDARKKNGNDTNVSYHLVLTVEEV